MCCCPGTTSRASARNSIHQRRARNEQIGRHTMSTVTLAGSTVEVDEEGFLSDQDAWNEQIAEEIARENGIEQLTDRHWQVISFMRRTYIETGSAPSIRSLGKA